MELLVENFDSIIYRIKEKLKSLGYRNKLIPYFEVDKLYELYHDGLTLKDFVQLVLEIKWDTYCNAKYLKHDVTVLMDRDRLNNEEIEQLILRLRNDGYAMKKINFSMLEHLFLVYGEGLTLKTFAIRVLKLTPGMYSKCRYGSEVRILQNVGDISLIQQQLKQDGYQNFLIEEYDVLESIYRDYGQEFTQKIFFKDVLNITIEQIKKLKRSHTPIPLFQEKNIEFVILQLKEKGYEGKLIDFNEFNQLYVLFQSYFLNDVDFAKRGLRLSKEEYNRLKKGERVTVLKPKKDYCNLSLVWQILKKENYLEKSISYGEFLELYKRFSNMLSEDISEIQFATIVLQISSSSFYTMKSGKKAIILKELTEKEIERLQNVLISLGYAGMKISYVILQKLHQKYAPFLSERQFSIRVLLLTADNYRSCKLGYQVTILFSKYRLSSEEIDLCKSSLKEMGYKNQSIDSNTREELYKNLGKGSNKTIFFSDVLENYYPYDKKNSHRILTSNGVVSEDIKNKIRALLESQNIYNHKISPSFINSLFDEYGRGLSFSAFLEEILGTSMYRYNEALKNQYLLIVKNPIKNAIMKRIYNKSFLENRYYSKQEILQVCKRNQVSLQDLIYYYFLQTYSNNNEQYLNDYMQILQLQNQLWFGHGKVNSSFFEQNYDVILSKAKIALSCIKKSFPGAYSCNEDSFDDIQNALIFLFENGQELEKNFWIYQNPLWERYCYGLLKKFLRYCALERIRKLKKNSLYSIDVLADQKNPYDTLFDNLDDSNDVITMLSEELLKGNKMEDSCERVATYFQISSQEVYFLVNEILYKNNNLSR